ncbi:MAG: hypothetical protein EA352_05545 [Gemmatimonadales bacterium]|nr:MAG: hypothetical protein EA352_05545 [Gemmatimonadales bacterium]
MSEHNAFVSPEYPVLFSVEDDQEVSGGVGLSLALLVDGIPSFLATVPVPAQRLDEVTDSLSAGDVRVAVVGISVDGEEVREADGAGEGPDEAWKASAPGDPLADAGKEDGGGGGLPAAFLSLVCRDGRKIGVARIVARQKSASPEDVARYVLKEIARGVQIPDLASAG